MNNLPSYLLELNIAIVILYLAYKLFFEKDRNFLMRRIYLLGVILLPPIMLLIPESTRLSVSNLTPSFHLAGITISGSGTELETTGSFSIGRILLLTYLSVLFLGLLKLVIQLTGIILAVNRSERINKEGITILLNRSFHASSFFSYIFIDPASLESDSFNHILEHEKIHKRDLHSVDRILAELFLLVNWFNPVMWLFRKSVIRNLEFLADSAVVNSGTDPLKYQRSILNQYIGNVSISNQFNSQIKNRIIMLNKDYKPGSPWKLFLLLPVVVIALAAISCTKNNPDESIPFSIQNSDENGNTNYQSEEMQQPEAASLPEEEVFYIVEDMPTFNGGDAAQEFRKYIAQNLKYPTVAAEKGISGRVIVQFTINTAGKVVDARVVRSVNPALDNEAMRVIMSSPDWTPGKQKGKTVKVLFTFPINFVLK